MFELEIFKIDKNTKLSLIKIKRHDCLIFALSKLPNENNLNQNFLEDEVFNNSGEQFNKIASEYLTAFSNK